MLGYGLDPEDDLPPFKGKPKSFYLLCSTPRCGSTLLGGLLTSSGAAGKPLEYFNPFLQLPLLERRFGKSDIRAIARRLFSLRTTANGVFGFKAHFDQYQFLSERLDPRGFFPGLKFILITRRDLLRQGISYYRAKESGVWSSLEGRPKDPPFSFEKIEEAINDIARKEAGWRKYFALAGAEPFEVSYEELLRDPQGSVRRLARFLHLGPIEALPPEALPHAPQRDEVTELWVESVHRYRVRGIAGVCADLLTPS